MKKYSKYIFILSAFYLIGCGGSDGSSEASNKAELVETVENRVAIIMPALPGVDILPSDNMEVK